MPITDFSLEGPDSDADAEEEDDTHANADADCVGLKTAFALALEELGGCVHVGFVNWKRRGRCFGVGGLALAFGGRGADD